LDSAQLRELCGVLEEGAIAVGELFEDRCEPSGSARMLFRQAALEYLRLHPACEIRNNWTWRWRIARIAVQMARGAGMVPRLFAGQPEATFDALEQPLGHLDETLQRPFLQFFAAQVASKQFAVASRPGWPIVDSYRALALGYAVGLWLLRLLSTGNSPTRQHAIDVVTMLDRGQGFGPLTAGRHRGRIRTLARLEELSRLVAWYGR
jgi:hypothetical protein